MNKVRVLDCTLRDGGYINQWDFGKTNIEYILNQLEDSEVDIVEVGFLSGSTDYYEGSSKFDSIEHMEPYIPNHKSAMHVCMVNYGDYKVADLPSVSETSIDGIRIAFHKKDLDDALTFAKDVSEKGYKVFLQPMVAANYTDKEYLDLIKKSEKVNPYAFYVVDSFGVMKQQDVIRYFYMADYNLPKDIYVGFHSHNNLQLAYSNAQSLLKVDTHRELIIDSSIYGMGRGAGNLNTELFTDYLNDLKMGEYNVTPLLNAIDYVLKPIKAEKNWGYALPFYLSAINNCHPNYASYLDDRGTLTIKAIGDILSSLDKDKRINFDKEYIQKVYYEYQTQIQSKQDNLEALKNVLSGKDVILVAPGPSIAQEEENVKKAVADENTITIAVNFEPTEFDTDYVFFSNLRRFTKARLDNHAKVILTSNIPNEKPVDYTVKYQDFLNEVSAVEDNAGMMLLKVLSTCSVNKVMLAGMDGYSLDRDLNFANKNMSIIQTKERLSRINEGLNTLLKEYSKHLTIEFLTTPRNVTI